MFNGSFHGAISIFDVLRAVFFEFWDGRHWEHLRIHVNLKSLFVPDIYLTKRRIHA